MNRGSPPELDKNEIECRCRPAGVQNSWNQSQSPGRDKRIRNDINENENQTHRPITAQTGTRRHRLYLDAAATLLFEQDVLWLEVTVDDSVPA